MAGKRKTHWAVRRKNKQARGDDGDDGSNGRRESFRKNEHVDRRAGFPEAIHPGSYAALRKAELDATADATADGATNANEETASKETKRRYGIWLAFCGKNYSGMQMYVRFCLRRETSKDVNDSVLFCITIIIMTVGMKA